MLSSKIENRKMGDLSFHANFNIKTPLTCKILQVKNMNTCITGACFLSN